MIYVVFIDGQLEYCTEHKMLILIFSTTFVRNIS